VYHIEEADKASICQKYRTNPVDIL